ncbi:MAG: envelope stress response membrane protein PspC [Pseudomonadota bacterium]
MSRHRHRRHRHDFERSPNPKRFYRSRDDRVWAGVCGGLAERYGWDPLAVRIGAVAAFFLFAGPLIIFAYIIIWMITPKSPIGRPPLDEEEDAFWRGVSDRPTVTFSNLKYTFNDLEDRLQRLERNVTSDEWRLRKEFRDLEQR